MACKDCTYYIDGRSRSGAKLPTGQGLCTIHNQDILASGNCNLCMPFSGKENQQIHDANPTTPLLNPNYTTASALPRQGMKVCSIVCFAFAVIYILMGFAIDPMMFGMSVFFGIFGFMFIVLKKSPKHISRILGRQTGLKKRTFVFICIVAAFCSFALICNISNGMDTTYSDGTGNSSIATEKARVTSIANFATTEYEMLVGENLDFSVELRPKDLTAEAVDIEVSNTIVLSVCDIKFTSEGRKTVLSFNCTALADGEATLVVKSITGDITSNTVSFKVTTPPLVTAISKFNPSNVVQKVGDKRTVTCYMQPLNLTQDDFIIENSNDSIISVTNIALGSKGEQTMLTFDVTGVGVGRATIKIIGADGKTESNELKFTIHEKDTSRTVYITPYGEKYHYSAACAGSNATATTEDNAIRLGLGRCKKCG